MILQYLMFRDNAIKPTNSGSRVKKTYKMVYESDGTRDVVHDSFEDIYVQIQSHKMSVDIHHIIDQCCRGLPVNCRYGDYGDISEAPKSFAEALNQLQTAEDIFKKLPAETKQKFDNSVSKFYATAFTEGWVEKLGFTHNELKEIEKAVTEKKVEVSETNE